MNGSETKAGVLREKGFVYHFSRMIYINSDRRKIFSHEAIDDNSIGWLIKNIAEASIPDEWQFYFNGIPSEELKRDILKEIAPSYVKE